MFSVGNESDQIFIEAKQLLRTKLGCVLSMELKSQV